MKLTFSFNEKFVNCASQDKTTKTEKDPSVEKNSHYNLSNLENINKALLISSQIQICENAKRNFVF